MLVISMFLIEYKYLNEITTKDRKRKESVRFMLMKMTN